VKHGVGDVWFFAFFSEWGDSQRFGIQALGYPIVGGNPMLGARGSRQIKKNQGFGAFRNAAGVLRASCGALDTLDTQNGGERWVMTGRD